MHLEIESIKASIIFMKLIRNRECKSIDNIHQTYIRLLSLLCGILLKILQNNKK